MSRRLSVCLLSSLLALAGCQSAPHVDAAAEEAAIRAIDVSCNEAIVTKNDSTIAAIYAADAVLMPPNSPTLTGPAIRQFWAGLWPINASLKISPSSVTVTSAGDHAIEQGTYSFEIPSTPGAIQDNGKYLVVWTKAGGTWKATKDIWNSDLPMAAPVAAEPAAPAKKK
jgi:ketosteroid isomerase-like protein